MNKILCATFLLMALSAQAQTPPDLGPIEPNVHTVEDAPSDATQKPAVDLPYKPKQDTPQGDITVEAHQGKAPKKTSGDPLENYDIAYILSKTPDPVGAPDPSL
ncbi:hypothetical protein K1X76_03230 [bacterium]|nr:hypothetical protein [bacterium]